MLLKMKRTQKTRIGRLAAGVAYTFDPKKADHAEVAASLLKRGMAEKTTKAAVAKAEEAAAAQAQAVATGEVPAGDVAPEIAERAAVAAQEAEEAAAKAGRTPAARAGKAGKDGAAA